MPTSSLMMVTLQHTKDWRGDHPCFTGTWEGRHANSFVKQTRDTRGCPFSPNRGLNVPNTCVCWSDSMKPQASHLLWQLPPCQDKGKSPHCRVLCQPPQIGLIQGLGAGRSPARFCVSGSCHCGSVWKCDAQWSRSPASHTQSIWAKELLGCDCEDQPNTKNVWKCGTSVKCGFHCSHAAPSSYTVQ